MNALDRLIATISPTWGLKRQQARRVLAYYEATKTQDPYRRKRREPGSANTAVGRAGTTLRQLARHAEQNHDLVRGILAILVANIAGPHGIGIEPQPRRRDGTLHTRMAEQIRALHGDWAKRPEVTWRHDWPRVQQLMVRTFVRDGESLAQHLLGKLSDLRHGSRVPFSLELLEPDYLPLDYSDTGKRIVQGVQHDRWARPTVYHLYKAHPGDAHNTFTRMTGGLRPVSASRMTHLALTDRLHQVRGVSVFASVLERLEDLKDYEESERIAAKVAASMAAYIRKGTPDLYAAPEFDENGNPKPRRMKFAPGVIFDDLLPGEDVGTIDTKRPSTQLEPHRKGQLRAVASGTYCTYSSAAKDYDGSYSSQRQELVEGWSVYGTLQTHFIGQFVRPIYERFIDAAIASGVLVLPADVDTDTLSDALFIGPQQPWIDPDKESRAFERLEENVHASGPEIIRRRGQNPRDVIEQQVAWEAERRRVLEQRLPEDGRPDTAARAQRNTITDFQRAD